MRAPCVILPSSVPKRDPATLDGHRSEAAFSPRGPARTTPAGSPRLLTGIRTTRTRRRPSIVGKACRAQPACECRARPVTDRGASEGEHRDLSTPPTLSADIVRSGGLVRVARGDLRRLQPQRIPGDACRERRARARRARRGGSRDSRDSVYRGRHRVSGAQWSGERGSDDRQHVQRAQAKRWRWRFACCESATLLQIVVVRWRRCGSPRFRSRASATFSCHASRAVIAPARSRRDAEGLVARDRHAPRCRIRRQCSAQSAMRCTTFAEDQFPAFSKA